MKKTGNFRERMILLGWVAGILLLISMLMVFTQPLQSYYLMRSVNRVFINSNDPRRISKYIPQKTGNADLLGFWYSMQNSEDYMFVFTIFKDGILIPAGAVVSPEGFVKEIFPLSAHAEQIFDTLGDFILQMYIARIEAKGFIE